MERKTLTAIVKNTRYLKNSVCGNPRVELRLHVGDVELVATTAINSSLGYLAEGLKNKKCVFTYHSTRTGRIVLDTLESEEVAKQ